MKSKTNRLPLAAMVSSIIVFSLCGLNARAALLSAIAPSNITHVWANEGGDKVTQDELRVTNGVSTTNTVWDGNSVKIFGASNEVVNFSLILESATAQANNVRVSLNSLSDGNGHTIASRASSGGNDVFNWVNRPIELFFVRYVQIPGLDFLNTYYFWKEFAIPSRFQLPVDGNHNGIGGWYDRPDHDKFYPDIAVPLELQPQFSVPAGSNQSIWTDIYIPKGTTPGLYTGTVTVSENGNTTWQVPVQLKVLTFSLPDVPTAKSMMHYGESEINTRMYGYQPTTPQDSMIPTEKMVRDRLFMLAHRHKISLIGDTAGTASSVGGDQPVAESVPRLDGSLFSTNNGYDGPGVGVGNDVYGINMYGPDVWWGGDQAQTWSHANNWMDWFNSHAPGVTPILAYLDEWTGREGASQEQARATQVEQWASMVKSNPGSGGRIATFNNAALTVLPYMPSLTIATFNGGINPLSAGTIANQISSDPSRKLWGYNGARPLEGNRAIEDDGVAMRELAWGQYKGHVDRWFMWTSTSWFGDPFVTAQSFGNPPQFDNSLGMTSGSYSNGDGKMIYPGIQVNYPSNSYGVDGVFASLRMKTWRRGIQDIDYATLASAQNATAVTSIVNSMVPKFNWEYDRSDGYIESAISWSSNPDDWERARAQLAALINPGDTNCLPGYSCQQSGSGPGSGTGSQTQSVDLTGVYDLEGIVTDGLHFSWSAGMDNAGEAYSASHVGTQMTVNGVQYSLAAPNGLNVVSASGKVINLPNGKYTKIGILGAIDNNPSTNSQTFTVTYTDNSTTTITQQMSDWAGSQNYPGETIANSSNYRNQADGTTQAISSILYEYELAIDSSKTVKSITLPNEYKVKVLSISVIGSATPAGNIQVDLSTSYDIKGVVTDGTHFGWSEGMDNAGEAYSASHVSRQMTVNGIQYSLAAPDGLNVVSASGKVINLPNGNYTKIGILGAIDNNPSTNSQKFTVTYTDSSTTIITQQMSDWAGSQNYPGETIANSNSYRNQADGTTQAIPSILYEYELAIDSSKTVKSITLPNEYKVKVLAITAVGSGSTPPPSNVQVDLSTQFNIYGIFTDGTHFSWSQGMDWAGEGYSATAVGSQITSHGVAFNLGAPNSSNVISPSANTISLPSGKFSKLAFLGSIVNNPPSNFQSFTVTYTDGSSSVLTQGMSDWCGPQNYPGETIAASIAYRNQADGGNQSIANDVYEYEISLDAGKTVQSISLPAENRVRVLAMTLVR